MTAALSAQNSSFKQQLDKSMNQHKCCASKNQKEIGNQHLDCIRNPFSGLSHCGGS